MKKVIKSIDKDFPPILFGCDFCRAEFVVCPPEDDMKIEYAERPIIEEDKPEYSGTSFYYVPCFKIAGIKEIITYITHCPICGEKVSWTMVTKKENTNEEDC